jgi:hypothetical protein
MNIDVRPSSSARPTRKRPCNSLPRTCLEGALGSEAAKEARVLSIHWIADKMCSRKLARAIGNDKAPGLFTEGFYRYSILSTSLDGTNHHLNFLLAQRFIFCLRDRLEPLRVFAV